MKSYMISKYVQLAVENPLQNGTYTVDTLINVINKFITWVQRLGIAAAGLALLIGFIVYAVVDVDQKPRAKQRIIQTLLGIVGIVIATSLISIILSLF